MIILLISSISLLFTQSYIEYQNSDYFKYKPKYRLDRTKPEHRVIKNKQEWHSMFSEGPPKNSFNYTYVLISERVPNPSHAISIDAIIETSDEIQIHISTYRNAKPKRAYIQMVSTVMKFIRLKKTNKQIVIRR